MTLFHAVAEVGLGRIMSLALHAFVGVCCWSGESGFFVGQDEPECVDQAGEVAEDGQDQVNPKMSAQADLQGGGQRGKDNGKYDFDDNHG